MSHGSATGAGSGDGAGGSCTVEGSASSTVGAEVSSGEAGGTELSSKGSTPPRDGTPPPSSQGGTDGQQVRPAMDGPAAQNKTSDAERDLVVAVGDDVREDARRDEDRDAASTMTTASADQTQAGSQAGSGACDVKGGVSQHGGASERQEAGGEAAANRRDDKVAEEAAIGSGTGRKKRAAAAAALSSFARGGRGAVSMVSEPLHVAPSSSIPTFLFALPLRFRSNTLQRAHTLGQK
jgi:hypothetical protein